ncbi:MAG: zinc-ribbon domain-containing protein [Anaerolineae bacterium]
MKDRICARCGHSNDGEAVFCTECGAALTATGQDQVCARCGFPNKPDTRFCVQCGAPLEERRAPRLPRLLVIGALVVVLLLAGGVSYAWMAGMIPREVFAPIERLLQRGDDVVDNDAQALDRSSDTSGEVVDDGPEPTAGGEGIVGTATVESKPTETAPVDDASRPTATSRPTETPAATKTPAASATPEPTFTPLPTHTETVTPEPTAQSIFVVETGANYGDEAALNGTYRVNDPNSARRCALGLASAPSQTNDGRAIAFEYTIQQASPDDYCGFERWWARAQSWSGHARLCLDISVTGTAEDLVVQFGEASGEVWKSWTASSSIGEGELCLPLSTGAFARAEWATKQNNRIDLAAITYFGIYVNGPPGASGTVYVNRIWVVSP